MTGYLPLPGEFSRFPAGRVPIDQRGVPCFLRRGGRSPPTVSATAGTAMAVTFSEGFDLHTPPFQLRMPVGTRHGSGGTWTCTLIPGGVEVIVRFNRNAAPPRRFVWRGTWQELHGDGGWLSVVNKYIAAAKAVVKKQPKLSEGLDPVLFKGRPALEAFMSELDGGEGAIRDVSPLMLFLTPEGLKVGLRDPDQNAWIWRVGETLDECLAAIEKELVSARPRWCQSQGARGSKGKK